MTVLRLDEILAQTDPFDLAQGIERHVSTLDGATIRELVAPVLDRAGKYYRNELSFLLDPGLGDEALRRSFIRFLTSNLRAIALFGAAFGDDVLKACPQHRVVAIGEERTSTKNTRTALIAGTAIALVILGAAAEHAVTNAKAAAQGAQPSTPIAVPVAIARPTARPHHRRVAPAPVPTVTVEPTVAAVDATPAAAIVQPPPAPPVSYQPAVEEPRPVPARRTAPAVTKGAVVNVEVTAPPPTPEPTPIDVNDMPESYSDATPLPEASNETADPQTRDVTIATPKPTAKPRHGVFKHLNPFQPGSHFRIP